MATFRSYGRTVTEKGGVKSGSDGPSRPRAPRWWGVALASLVLIGLVAAAALFFRPDASENAPSAQATRGTSTDSSGAGRSDPSASAEATPDTDSASGVSSSKPTPVPTAAPSTTPATVGPHPTAPPVPLSAPASPAAEVRAELASIDAVTASAELPGETGGPALEITLEISNGTNRDFDLAGAVINLYYGRDRVPAVPIESASDPLPPMAGPDSPVTGSYVFRVPVEERRQIRVEVDLGIGRTVVLFEGAAPR